MCRIMRPPWTGPRSSSATTSSPPRTGRPPTVSFAAPSVTASSGSSTRRRRAATPARCSTAASAASRSSRAFRKRFGSWERLPTSASSAWPPRAAGSRPGLRGLLAEAISLGMSVVNGLHEFVSDDPGLVAAAAAKGVSITDVRKTAKRTDLHFWSGDIGEVRAPRIAVLGTDCALGKRTTARFLMEACRRAGLRTELIFTGQTGWMQGAPYGFIFDSIPNDFVSGELEHAVVSCWRNAKPELILFEGQSALRNPSGPCGSEFLLSGGAKGVILQHAPARVFYEGLEELGYRIPPLSDEIALDPELRGEDAGRDAQRRASDARRAPRRSGPLPRRARDPGRSSARRRRRGARSCRARLRGPRDPVMDRGGMRIRSIAVSPERFRVDPPLRHRGTGAGDRGRERRRAHRDGGRPHGPRRGLPRRARHRRDERELPRRRSRPPTSSGCAAATSGPSARSAANRPSASR